MHVVELRLRGQLTEEIQVTLEWRPEHSFQTQGTLLGSLPPNPHLSTLYGDWHQHYRELGDVTRLEIDATSEPRFDLRRRKHHAKQQCDAAAQRLEDHFRQWLHTSDGFQRITRQLSELYGAAENIRLLIRADDSELQRLPWHLWSELERHDRPIPMALSSIEYKRGQSNALTSPVRVLAILGSSLDLDLTPDLATLNRIANIELTLLEQPSRRQVAESLLSEKGWDILFFAGHSSTEDGRGILSINETDRLTSKELHHHLSVAAAQGLKICIFNSCDGFGLARHLFELKIPYVIYMKEPVPDPVAHHFFQQFIKHFAEENHSLHSAVWAARHELEALQDRFPYATWLPTLHQQPQADALWWPQFDPVPRKPVKRVPFRFRYWILLATPLGILLTLQFLSHLSGTPPQSKNASTSQESLGDNISTGEEVLGASPIHKIKAVNFLRQKKYKDGIKKLLESWQDDGKDPETLIYLNNALLDAYQIKHHTIAVSVPFLYDRSTNQISSHDLADRVLQGVAQAQTEANLNLGESSIASSSLGRLPNLLNLLSSNSIEEKVGLKVVIADDRNVVVQAPKQANLLASNSKIMGVVGHYASDMSEPTIPIYRKNRMPVISPGSTAKDLTELGAGYFFRTVPITTVEAKSVANYLLSINKKKVMVYYNPQSPFTHSFWDDFKDIYEKKGGKIVKQVQQGDSISDLASLKFDPNRAISALARYGNSSEMGILLIPDGEVSPAQEHAFDLLAANAGRYAIVGAWGMDNPKTLDVLSETRSTSLVVSVPWHHTTSPSRDFPNQTEQLWGQTVRGQTALAYDATRALIAALRAQSQPSRQGTRDALADPKFKVEGATGQIAFERNGDRKSHPQVLIRAFNCPSQHSQVIFKPIDYRCPSPGTPD